MYVFCIAKMEGFVRYLKICLSEQLSRRLNTHGLNMKLDSCNGVPRIDDCYCAIWSPELQIVAINTSMVAEPKF